MFDIKYMKFKKYGNLDEFINTLIEFRDKYNCGELIVYTDGYLNQPEEVRIIEETKRINGEVIPAEVYIF